MNDIKIRYTFRRKEDGHLWQSIWWLETIETGGAQYADMMKNKLWEIIGRDLYTGISDKENTELFQNDILGNDEGQFKIEWNVQNGCWWLSPLYNIHKDDWVIKHIQNQKLGDGTYRRKDMVKIGDCYYTPELLQSL